MMNTAFVWVFLWPFNIFALCAVVKCQSWHVSNMSKTIPLCAGLRVELIFVIVCNVFKQFLNFVLEDLTAECWHIWDIQWKI